MKKIVCCFFVVFLLALITACENTRQDAPSITGQTESSTATEGDANMREEAETDAVNGENGILKEDKDDMAKTGVFNLL